MNQCHPADKDLQGHYGVKLGMRLQPPLPQGWFLRRVCPRLYRDLRRFPDDDEPRRRARTERRPERRHLLGRDWMGC